MTSADYERKRAQHELWREDEAALELARLGAIVLSFDRKSRAPLRAFVDNVSNHSQLTDRIAGKEGEDFFTEIRRLISFENITDHAFVLDMVADYVLAEIEKRKTIRTKDNRLTARYLEHAFSRIRLDLAVRDHKSNSLKSPFWENYRTIGPSGVLPSRALTTGLEISPESPADNQSRLVPLSSAFWDFKIYSDQFKDASRYLNGEEVIRPDQRQARRVHFACFRYSSTVGMIAKSYFTFLPCTIDDPVCRFDHSFRDQDGNARDSVGIAYSANSYIYLLGQTRREHAPKVVAFSAIGVGGGRRIPALVMSKTNAPLVARALLVRIDELPEQLDARVAPERDDPEFSNERFRAEVVPYIKNETEFELNQKILFRDEETMEEMTLTQSGMVARLPELLRGRFVLRDESSGIEIDFNPAAHAHYPFNQAIALKSKGG